MEPLSTDSHGCAPIPALGSRIPPQRKKIPALLCFGIFSGRNCCSLQLLVLLQWS